MKKSTRAIYLSAFVVPGAGQWYLGKRWQALALMLVSAVATYVVMSNVWEKTNLIAKQIASGEIQPELSVLMDILAEHSSAAGSSSMSTATLVLAVVWVLGVVGAWMSGRAIPS